MKSINSGLIRGISNGIFTGGIPDFDKGNHMYLVHLNVFLGNGKP